jgi:hypothetical protein
MKVRIVSDIHIEFCQGGEGIPDLGKGDVLILGGDILCAKHFKTNGPLHEVYKDFLQKCIVNFDHVIYILGNHEYFGYNWGNTIKVLKENFPPSIHILENEYVKVQDTIFLGCTLWSDFRNENPLEMMDCGGGMNDYRKIRIGSNYRKLNPDDTLKVHKQSKQFLLEKLEEFKNEKIWIATHHAPSYQSIHQKYKTYSCTGAYCSDLDDLIMTNPQIKYWSHGHTHSSFRYKIGECEVMCNPRGYFPCEINPNFDPNFTVEI